MVVVVDVVLMVDVVVVVVVVVAVVVVAVVVVVVVVVMVVVDVMVVPVVVVDVVVAMVVVVVVVVVDVAVVVVDVVIAVVVVVVVVVVVDVVVVVVKGHWHGTYCLISSQICVASTPGVFSSRHSSEYKRSGGYRSGTSAFCKPSASLASWRRTAMSVCVPTLNTVRITPVLLILATACVRASPWPSGTCVCPSEMMTMTTGTSKLRNRCSGLS